MNYLSGEEIRIGDKVLIEHGRTAGVIRQLISSVEDQLHWNLSERGVMINAEPFGLVFWPIDSRNDAVVFVERKS